MQRQDTVEQFRQRLVEIIERTGLSRSAFARKVAIDRSTLSQILSDKTDRLPRLETLTAIATSENVSLDWLVGLSQEGVLSTDILPQSVEIHTGGTSPSDALMEAWRREATGYKIRTVPKTIPDLFKTEAVIEWEYQAFESTTPEFRLQSAESSLAYRRKPDTDTEVCTSVQAVEELARGEGLWSGLQRKARIAQLDRMIELLDELYPRFRWFLFDGRSRFSVPLTVFGWLRAAIYVGQAYLVFNGIEHIQSLTNHFDDLIRSAVVQPTEVGKMLRKLRAET